MSDKYFIIGADIVPTMSNFDLFVNGYGEELVGKELFDIFKNASYRIFNLEVPLTDSKKPIDKCGPNLVAPTSCVNGYRSLLIDAMTLANNHILDQGDEGLINTLDTLKCNGIKYFGAGLDLNEAKIPLYFDFAGRLVGIIGCCQHEFSIAKIESPGASPFDIIESFDHIEEISAKCDYLIILYHGGIEHYRYPTPYLQKICHKMVDKGADLIVCQHSHCVGTFEEYGHGCIVYGQGNFLFDHQDNEYWADGILLKIDEDFNISYIPIMKQTNKVRIASSDVTKRIVHEIESRNLEIKENGFVDAQFKLYSAKEIDRYLGMFGGKDNIFFKCLNRLMGNRLRKYRVYRKYQREQRLMLRNYIECEAHREVILSGLGK